MNDGVFIKIFAERVLEMEKDALKNINKPDDKQMVARIIKQYEEEMNQNDNK